MTKDPIKIAKFFFHHDGASTGGYEEMTWGASRGGGVGGSSLAWTGTAAAIGTSAVDGRVNGLLVNGLLVDGESPVTPSSSRRRWISLKVSPCSL